MKKGRIEPIIKDNKVIGHQWVSDNIKNTTRKFVGSELKINYNKSEPKWDNSFAKCYAVNKENYCKVFNITAEEFDLVLERTLIKTR